MWPDGKIPLFRIPIWIDRFFYIMIITVKICQSLPLKYPGKIIYLWEIESVKDL